MHYVSTILSSCSGMCGTQGVCLSGVQGVRSEVKEDRPLLKEFVCARGNRYREEYEPGEREVTDQCLYSLES